MKKNPQNFFLPKKKWVLINRPTSNFVKDPIPKDSHAVVALAEPSATEPTHIPLAPRACSCQHTRCLFFHRTNRTSFIALVWQRSTVN